MAPKSSKPSRLSKSASSKPPLKQPKPSPPSDPPSKKPARNPPEDYPAPPEVLFRDAQIDLAGTIACNAASLHGDVALETQLHELRRFLEPRLEKDGRVAVHVVAAFVEGERAEGGSLTRGDGATSQGSEQAAGPSDPLGARVKLIGDLMGGQAARGHDCLRNNPDAPKDSTARFRTLSVEDATLYVLNCFAEQRHSPLREQPGEGAGGEELDVELGFSGALPMVWSAQLEKWAAEGVDEEECIHRMRQTIARCLPALPVFVMKNGGRYLSTSHLKYMLGVEKRPYELFRMIRERNGDGATELVGSGSEGEPGEWDSDEEFFEDRMKGKVFTAGEGIHREYDAALTLGGEEYKANLEAKREERVRREMVSAVGGNPFHGRAYRAGKSTMFRALATMAPTSSPEGLAEVVIQTALARGDDDVNDAAMRACEQAAALHDGAASDRFRKAAIVLVSGQLAAAEADGPPPEAFAAMGARMRAAKAARRGEEEGARGEAEPGVGASADRKAKRIVPEPDAGLLTGQQPEPSAEEEARASRWTAEGEPLDGPDPEAETDVWTAGDDWDRWRWDRPGFVPNAAVPIKSLGEISRFWMEFGVPDQVVVMQAKYNSHWEAQHTGRHNLWTFKVLSNILPMSRFLKSAPPSETFIAFDLAREAFSDYTPSSHFGHSIAIAAYAHSEGVPMDEDTVHADSMKLLRMARGLGGAAANRRGDGASEPAADSGAGAEPPLMEEEQRLVSAMASQARLNAREAKASAVAAAVQVEKERMLELLG